jgi:4-amino-4-deoxy-L-arabinose transferase-like glycosyltransferase
MLAGVLVGAFATALSILGLVWKIGWASLALSAALAVAALLAAKRVLGPWHPVKPVHLLVLLSLAPVLAVDAFPPPRNRDEVAYSAALPRDFARAGRFFYNADYGPYSAFPANYEALTTASLVATGSVAAVKLGNLAMALGMAVVAGALAQALGARRRAALVAGLFVMAAPAIVTYVPVAKNDVANAFFQCLAVVGCVRWLERPRPALLLLAGAFLGVAIGIKYTSFQFAACLGACLILAAWRVPMSRGARVAHLAGFAGVALAAGAPWLVRNALMFGNPVFPVANALFHAHNGFGPNQAAILKEMFRGPADYSLVTGSPVAFARKMAAGFGAFVCAAAVAGLVVSLRRRERSPATLFVGALFLAFGGATLLFGFWEPRYVLTLLILGAAFAAALVDTLDARFAARWPRAAGRLPAMTLIAVLVWADGFLTQVREYLPELSAWARLPAGEFRARAVPWWDVAAWVNANVGPGDKIGLGIDVQPFFYIDRPYFHIHPFSEKGDLASRQGPDDFLAAFRELGLTMLGFQRWDVDLFGFPPATTPQLRAFVRRFDDAVDALARRGSLVPLATVGGVTMYRIAGAR